LKAITLENTVAHINAIGIANPKHDIHSKFLSYVTDSLPEPRERAVFQRMAKRSGINHRWSMLTPDSRKDRIDEEGFYRTGHFPSTAIRMARYSIEAPKLAISAIKDLQSKLGTNSLAGVTHFITVSCTGFTAPGLDVAMLSHFGLSSDVERTTVGFMGCNAAFNGFKLARHIVRSDPRAKVLVLNLELCTLHFQTPQSIDQALMFLLFADGASATLISAESSGLALNCFAQEVIPDTTGEITWDIGDQGFNMYLSGEVPRHIRQHLSAHVSKLLGGTAMADVHLWAVHPGGRSVLDSVQGSLDLPDDKLTSSRNVLHDFGNMSSVTVPFILRQMMDASEKGRQGVALGFGPGLGVESFTFSDVA
jgi:alpha-pyrone synthase